jgi:8-oxo-dGTP pyrophosphatase MutT (NUDIX family)
MYKLFYKDRTIYLTASVSGLINVPGNLLYSYHSIEQLIELIDCFPQMNHFRQLIVYHNNIDQIFEKIKTSFRIIKAGGGVVQSPGGKILVIKRKNIWDLPKGKAEKNESAEQTAVREVKEECHLDKLNVNSFISKSYHFYRIKDEMVLKETHWYDMLYQGDADGKPQTAEDITEIRWFGRNDIKEVVFKNTYLLIKDLLKHYV